MGILEWIQNIDAQILLFIQQYIRQDMMNWFWKGITFLGDGGWFWIVLGVVLLIPKKTRKSGFTALLALIIGSVITNLVLKTAVARIRPYDAVEGLVPLVKKLRDYSFPSGHTCASFSCAVVYYKMYPDIKGKGAMVLAVLIALSRLYVGVHYPTDVLGGAIVGWLSAILALKISVFTEKKKAAGGLLLSAALTAFLTGITEPLEFTFIFVALPMYAVHCVLAGLSFMLMHILNVGVGMTFSGGLIDLVLFGVMQGNAKTHWIWVVVVGAVYFVLYYLIFRFMISKFNYKTPGRDDAEEVKLYTRADVNARSAASGSTAPAGDDPVSALIVEGLGGAANLSDVDCCATRLRCTVKDAALVRQDVLKASGASGVICKGNGVQVVYGPKVAVIKAKLEDYLENAPKTPAATATPAPAAPAAKDTVLSACLNGTVVPLADVKDEAFASGALGDGIAIEPTDGELVAPADGEISSTFETHHAVGMTTADGAELLMHIGIDTVKLGGKHFTYLVNEGDKVKKGQPLIRFDIEAIKAEGYPVTTPLIVCNTDDYAAVAAKASGTVKQGDALLELKH